MGRRDAQRDVIVVERGGSSFWSLLVGAAVGAGIALLFAPQSGVKTRRALGKKFSALRDSAEEAYEEFTEALHSEDEEEEEEDAAEEGEESEGEDPDSLEEAPARPPMASGRPSGSPARRELEKRLAAARARRQRALAEEDEEPVA